MQFYNWRGKISYNSVFIHSCSDLEIPSIFNRNHNLFKRSIRLLKFSWWWDCIFFNSHSYIYILIHLIFKYKVYNFSLIILYINSRINSRKIWYFSLCRCFTVQNSILNLRIWIWWITAFYAYFTCIFNIPLTSRRISVVIRIVISIIIIIIILFNSQTTIIKSHITSNARFYAWNTFAEIIC